MAWIETASAHFVARHDDADADGAEQVLAQLEGVRERLASRLPALPEGEIAVVLHGSPAQLHLAQPVLPLIGRLVAPASRRYLAGWVTSDALHVLSPNELRERASSVPGSREMLALTPAALYARRALAACNPLLGPPFRPPRIARELRWAWLTAGAAQRLSGQTAHARPAIVRRLREGDPPSFPPRLRDAHLLGGTVLDLLAREEGEGAVVRLACGPLGDGPEGVLTAAFAGRPLRQTEAAWRSHLVRLAGREP